ncbi:hypothetical protein BT93_G0934 [Corymbia citriodora subsp. variegata]|nr:hypothetical protein BT93_G0934 [Corymbia citriodora subsp. variegata]
MCSAKSEKNMARNSQSLGLAALLLLHLLLLGSAIFKTEAIRPLEGAALPHASVGTDRLFKKISSVRLMVTEAGPSPEGPGHRYMAPQLASQSNKNRSSHGMEHK